MLLKKGILILLANLAALSFVVAQSDDYVRPTITPSNLPSTILSLGLGFGGDYPITSAIYVENPGITLSGERPIFKHAGPGTVNIEALLSYKSIYSGYTDYYTGYNYDQRWNYYIFGTRLSYHLKSFTNKKMEPYVGIMLGYYVSTFKFSSDDPDYLEPNDPGYSLKFSNTTNFFAPSIFIGVRSWITQRSSIWFEAGYGYSAISFGASYRI